MTALTDKTVLIRADSSPLIGTGHVMRCSVLADALQAQGAIVSFACRSGEGDRIAFLRAQGYDVTVMPSAALPFHADDYASWLGDTAEHDAAQAFDGRRYDLAIVDHYGAGLEWQKQARTHASRLIVIDDEARADFDCDLLLNQNYYPQGAALYAGKIPEGCRVLAGPAFALLRPEFAAARESVPARERLRHVLVMMGGADPQQVGRRIVEALDTDLAVTVVAGAAYRAAGDLRSLCAGRNFAFLQSVDDVASLMARADLCIGAGGSTSWERCCLKLPALLFSIAANQQPIADNLEKTGAALSLGAPDGFDFTRLNALLTDLRRDPARLAAMSAAAGVLTDGHGAVRVAGAIEELVA